MVLKCRDHSRIMPDRSREHRPANGNVGNIYRVAARKCFIKHTNTLIPYPVMRFPLVY